MKKIFLTITLAVGLMATAQVKIGNDPTNIDANSILELETTNQGLLFPRVALVSTTSYAPLNDTLPNTKQKGMTVYNTATTGDVTPGLYTNDGTKWVKMGAATVAPLNITAEQSGNYTALATDDIILISSNSSSIITLPTSGVSIGKKIYVSIKGTGIISFSPAGVIREDTSNSLNAGISGSLIFVGGSAGIGNWSVISGY